MPQGMGAGFVEGLSGHLDQRRAEKIAEEGRRTAHAREAIKLALDSGQVENISDLEPLLQVAWPDVYSEAAKKKGKGGVAPHDIANQFLQHAWDTDRQNRAATPMAMGTPAPAAGPANPQVLPPMGGGVQPTPAPAETTGQGGPPSDQSANEQFGLPSGQEPLPSKAVVLPQQHAVAAPEPVLPTPAPAATPPPQPGVSTGTVPMQGGQRRSLMGIPLMTVEEAQQREINRSVSKTGQTIQAQMDLARRLLPAMKAVDPSITLPMLMQEITGHRLGGVGSGIQYQTVQGSINGKAASAVFDRARGAYVDPITHEPLQDFVVGRIGAQNTRLTGAAGAAVNKALLAMGLDPGSVDHTSPEYAQAVKQASAQLEAQGNLSDQAKLDAANLKRWSLGEPPLTALPKGGTEAAPAASTAAAGAGVPPGAAPSAQEPTSPAVAPTGAAPAPTPDELAKMSPQEGRAAQIKAGAAKPSEFEQRQNEQGTAPVKKYKGAVYDTLDPVMQREAERFAFYQQAPPGTRAAVTPRVAKELAAAQEINPDFSQVNYPNIQQGLKAFTTGKQGDNIASLNMTLGHLETFAKKAEQLDNTDITLWNKAANIGIANVGDPRVKGMLVAREALSNELTRLFRGTGGNEEEVKNWRAALDQANSPAQFAEAVRTLDDLITSRQKSLKNQWGTIQGAPSWEKMGFVPQDTLDAVARTDVIARRMASGQAPPKKPQTSQPSKKPASGASAPVPGAQIINGKIVYSAPAGQ